MKYSVRVIFLLNISLLLLSGVSVHADFIRKHDGEIIDGKFLGGTEYVVYFYATEGRLEISVEEILSISFLPSSAALPRRDSMPTPTPTPSPEELFVTVPGDTRVLVRLLTPMDSLISREGDRFDALLAQDIAVGERVVFPKDTPASGVVVRSEQGESGSALVIELREFRLAGQRIPLSTSSYAIWDLPKSGEDVTWHIIRTLSIKADAIVGFKTLTPLTLELK